MRELSVFVDESGDPGTESEYYLVALVFHDQRDGAEKFERGYLNSLRAQGLDDILLHLSPLLNGHDDYEGMDIQRRKRHLAAFRIFTQYLPFRYSVFAYKKSELDEDPSSSRSVVQRIRRDLAIYLLDHLDHLRQFDRVKIYCDNGRELVTKALHDAFEYVPSKKTIIYRNASPGRYRLSQVADCVCTLELDAIKYENKKENWTDELFFGNRRHFEKNYLRKLKGKLLC